MESFAPYLRPLYMFLNFWIKRLWFINASTSHNHWYDLKLHILITLLITGSSLPLRQNASLSYKYFWINPLSTAGITVFYSCLTLTILPQHPLIRSHSLTILCTEIIFWRSIISSNNSLQVFFWTLFFIRNIVINKVLIYICIPKFVLSMSRNKTYRRLFLERKEEHAPLRQGQPKCIRINYKLWSAIIIIATLKKVMSHRYCGTITFIDLIICFILSYMPETDLCMFAMVKYIFLSLNGSKIIFVASPLSS